MIAKARKEITNLAEVETIEMTIAGKSTIENNRHLFWIISAYFQSSLNEQYGLLPGLRCRLQRYIHIE